jgi:hypothetical protein
MIFFYFLQVGVMTAAVVFSWMRFRHVMHPHFIFSVILFVHYSDFFVRGYDDLNLELIDPANLIVYQTLTLACFALPIFITGMWQHKDMTVALSSVRDFGLIGRNAGGYALLVAMIFIVVEMVKRLYLSDWSPSWVFEQMLGPRNERQWVPSLLARDLETEQIVSNPFFQLISAMFPIAAIITAFNIVFATPLVRVVSFIAYLFAVFVLLTDGTRTPIVLAIASVTIFALLKFRSFGARVAVAGLGAAMIVVLTSVMILFRSEGYSELLQSRRDYGVTYHQDDSIYRAWSAYDRASKTDYRWDPGYFAFTVVATPVPRAIWPDKPFLSQAYFGIFKLDYVTILFLGEFVAMFGVFGGTFAGFLYCILVYRLWLSFAPLLTRPFGLVGYLFWALWVYSLFRSVQNLSLLIYAPVAATLLILWIGKIMRTDRPAIGNKGPSNAARI